METFYFTYSCDGTQPFNGGWTEVEAPNRSEAYELFRQFHPDKNPPFLNCAGIHSKEEMEKTQMFKFGNYGKLCVERIKINE